MLGLSADAVMDYTATWELYHNDFRNALMLSKIVTFQMEKIERRDGKVG